MKQAKDIKKNYPQKKNNRYMSWDELLEKFNKQQNGEKKEQQKNNPIQ